MEYKSWDILFNLILKYEYPSVYTGIKYAIIRDGSFLLQEQ